MWLFLHSCVILFLVHVTIPMGTSYQSHSGQLPDNYIPASTPSLFLHWPHVALWPVLYILWREATQAQTFPQVFSMCSWQCGDKVNCMCRNTLFLNQYLIFISDRQILSLASTKYAPIAMKNIAKTVWNPNVFPSYSSYGIIFMGSLFEWW